MYLYSLINDVNDCVNSAYLYYLMSFIFEMISRMLKNKEYIIYTDKTDYRYFHTNLIFSNHIFYGHIFQRENTIFNQHDMYVITYYLSHVEYLCR